MTHETTDIWFASFLDRKGIQMTGFEVTRPGKGKFIYNSMAEDEWKNLKLEFNNSPELEQRNRIEKIKNLIY